MSKTDNPTVVVELEIPLEEANHLLDLVYIHQDYKKVRGTFCLECRTLKEHLLKGIKLAIVKRDRPTHEEMVDNWTGKNKQV